MEYSIKPKRLGERRIIHYPQKRIIGLYVYKVSIFEYDKEKEEKKLRKAERECGREEGREEGRMEERKSLLALIAKMSAGGDADKIIRLEDPEVMNAMQKKYEIR